MRTYEAIYIVNPETTGDAYTAIVDKFKGVLTEQGANIIKVDEWGVRKMAYPIKKQTRGSYVLTVFEARPEVIKEFERRMRIDENIMKFQTVYLEKGFEASVPADAQDVDAAADQEEESE
ncbi:30S ribosomal protein S6 [Desulfuromonas sp. AOP6]|uniref:30S ribosomal protein S6 n=1 Tax=Desulfuromonas sp. AOP6 TaxID=1566351 RepID=UPI0012779D3C|nr:30S ribosomal protein S6 [Desulfuromonas sp. AOP6]BCA80334.1 30S ribosomal protein S6 [Desulfuromonas sp. AOP6]